MNTTEQFTTLVERDSRVIEEIRQTLYVLGLLNLAEVSIQGATMKLVLSRELERIKHILRMWGASDDWLLGCLHSLHLNTRSSGESTDAAARMCKLRTS